MKKLIDFEGGAIKASNISYFSLPEKKNFLIFFVLPCFMQAKILLPIVNSL